jgi:myo-inositol-1(or 4)-monophosphatase
MVDRKEQAAEGGRRGQGGPDGRAAPSYDDLLALAVDVAGEAVALVRQRRLQGVAVAGTKTSPTDVVTEVDKATERLIYDRLLAARPDDGFVGEEGASSRSTSAVEWVVDPIDGTVNFVYGIPTYAVSIAAAVDGESVAGVVLDVQGGERFTATRGGGAFLDGSRLQVDATAPVPPLSQRLVGTGFSYRRDVRMLQVAAVSQMLSEVRDIRRIGSAALDLCYVGAGRFDAYVEEGLNRWDMAAGGLVATEAGAVLSRRVGAGGSPCYLCAPAGGYDDFRDLVERCGFLGPDARE